MTTLSENTNGDIDFQLNRLYFYLTDGCNLACRHCWLAPKTDLRTAVWLPSKTFESVIQEAMPLGLSGVKITGGEPLLHPEFIKLVGTIRDNGLVLSLETNGMLCTEKIAAEIAGCREKNVSVSIDGADAETHDRIRGVRGSFEKAVRAVKNLAAAGVSPQIIMSVMRGNADQISDMIRMAEDAGASSVKFNVVQPIARGETLGEDGGILGVPEIIALGRHVDEILAPTTQLRVLFDYPLAFRPLSRIASDGNDTCGIFGILGVLPNGSYALCGIGTHIPDMVFGIAGKDALDTVWLENPVLKGLRSGIPGNLEGVCGRCLMKRRCLGACVAQNQYRSGRLWAPFWFCEAAEKEGVFPKTRLA